VGFGDRHPNRVLDELDHVPETDSTIHPHVRHALPVPFARVRRFLSRSSVVYGHDPAARPPS
jgi:hypothetical protein